MGRLHGGALDENDYRVKLAAAGFDAIGIEATRIYDVEDAREFLTGKGIDVDAIAPQIEGKFRSAFVRARKPGAAPPGDRPSLLRCLRCQLQRISSSLSLRPLGPDQPPVTLICRGVEARETAGSMTKSCPFGLRSMAARIAASSRHPPRTGATVDEGRLRPLARGTCTRFQCMSLAFVAALAKIVGERSDEAHSLSLSLT